MAEKHNLKIEVLAATNIEAEVPRQQQLRQPSHIKAEENSTQSEDDKVEIPMEPSNSAATENGEPISWSGLRNLMKPVYVGEPVRPPHRFRRRRLDSEESPGSNEEKSSPEDKKPKTRIPVSRFKPAVNKVQRERKASEDANNQKSKKEAPEKPPRRSSIPKLNDRILAARKNTFKTEANDQTSVINNDEDPVKSVSNEEPVVETLDRKPLKVDGIPVIKRYANRLRESRGKKVENDPVKTEVHEDLNAATAHEEEPTTTEVNDELNDEFDKLYEEIVDTELETISDEISDTTVKDPERLEIKFEEIVHQYDEETVEQVQVEPADKARYSKIPLLKRRSEQEIKVPKQHERRLSLKTGTSFSNNYKTKHEEKTKDDKVLQQTDGKNTDDDVTENNTQGDPITEINYNENDSDYIIGSQSPILTPPYNIIATPDAELVKVGLSNSNIALERYLTDQNTDVNNIATPEAETVKVSILDISVDTDAPLVELNKDFEIEEVKEVEYLIEEPISINETQETISITIIDQPCVTEVDDKEILIENGTVLRQQLDDANKDVKYEHETVKVAKIDFDTAINEETEMKLKRKGIIFPNNDDELKSFKLLRSTSNIEERTKSRYINKPLKIEEDKTKFTESDENDSGILTRLTSHENKANELNANENKNNDLPSLKENVSKILNRITSQDVDQNAKKEIDDIPKKKSVLSKIAMFERPAPEPITPNKPIAKYSKPKRTISEEIRHSPKIVQEVLKPSIRNAQTDKPYQVVNIDIMKPIEVANNEEQIIIVEELKEHSIVYENLDNSKLEEVNTIKDEPSVITILDPNETSLSNSFETNEYQDNDVPPRDQELSMYKPENPSTNQSDISNSVERNDNGFFDVDKKVQNWKSREALSQYVPVKEKIQRLQSYEETNMKRAKSTAELDLGEAVKGKVKNMIYRINSVDFLDDNKQKEVINIKERPRTRSVSEKIALFEKRLQPVNMGIVDQNNHARAPNTNVKPGVDINADPDSVLTKVDSNGTKVDNAKATSVDVVNATKFDNNSTSEDRDPVDATRLAVDENAEKLEEEYKAKIKELSNARLKYERVTNMPYIELRDGKKMPVLALGTALLDPRLAKHIVEAAIDLGYRAIDTAFIYGTEKEVGEGIRAKIQDGTVKREELFIMSKLWSTFHQPELVEPACRASLRALGLDYFDLFMIHNPMSFKEGGDPLPKIANVLQFSTYDYMDAWFAMEQLPGKGFARSLGVSNFNSEQLARVLDKGRVKPVINQVECHPYLNQQRLSSFCDERDVRLSCYGSLGSKGTPAGLKSSQLAAIDDPLVQVMAAGLEITPAQLLIKYQLQCGHNVVVKGSSAAHLWDNLQALDVSLTSAQMEALHALNKNKRTFTFKGMGDTHRNYPFLLPF